MTIQQRIRRARSGALPSDGFPTAGSATASPRLLVPPPLSRSWPGWSRLQPAC